MAAPRSFKCPSFSSSTSPYRRRKRERPTHPTPQRRPTGRKMPPRPATSLFLTFQVNRPESLWCNCTTSISPPTNLAFGPAPFQDGLVRDTSISLRFAWVAALLLAGCGSTEPESDSTGSAGAVSTAASGSQAATTTATSSGSGGSTATGGGSGTTAGTGGLADAGRVDSSGSGGSGGTPLVDATSGSCGKRGIASVFDISSAGADLAALAAPTPGISWFYGWSRTPSSQVGTQYIAAGVEWVPMVWGKLDELNDANLAGRITVGPNTKYLLGYNEPTFPSQA